MTDMTLTDFLLARIAEDEAEADHVMLEVANGVVEPLHASVLAECEAKRRIVEHEVEGLRSLWRQRRDEHQMPWERWRADWSHLERTPVLRALAGIYADHPDYREEWRP